MGVKQRPLFMSVDRRANLEPKENESRSMMLPYLFMLEEWESCGVLQKVFRIYLQAAGHTSSAGPRLHKTVSVSLTVVCLGN
jgi:hypothetical protein